MEYTENKQRIEYSLAVRQNLFDENEISIEKALVAGTPMNVAAAKYDKMQIVKLLSFAIGRCVNNFNVSKNMSEDQIIDLAIDWMESYSVVGSYDEPTIRIEEVLAFLELAKTGKYGQPFDRMDAGIMQGWFEKYYSQRRQAYFDRLDSNRYDPEQKQITGNDALNSKILSLAGKMSVMKEKTLGE